ncbi:MAG: hypothetical protein PHR68_03285 [Candidatus Gracilibacteria bacterium]|nr:hypothetical protein [Candidatus Gracilibacteria bacterium]
MTTLTIEKTDISKTHFVDTKDLFLYVIDYMQDLEDKEKVKNEIKNDDGYRISFDLDYGYRKRYFKRL